jgi:DNA replication regulator SLD3
MNDLIDFLKSLVLTTVQIDTKYRESIPDTIAKMKTQVYSSDEQHKRKKRKPKKVKLGKDGMYSNEADYIRQWWNSNKPELQGDEATVSQQQIKSHVALLRTRETQLQMILILEILALEPLRVMEDEVDGQLPGLPGDSPEVMAPPPKKRSKHNFPVLMDVHADRLCIWQSTASDDLRLLEDSQSSGKSIEGHKPQKPSSEPLKDYCVDIIMPL